MTVETGHFDVLRRSFSRVSDDQRIQAVLIAFSFGALLEALAGFGTPVAVTSVMLMALGFKPMKAAVLALVANTAPVAFGAMATPIITLAQGDRTSAPTLSARWSVARRRSWRCSCPLSWSPSSTAGAASARPGRRPLVCGLVFGVAQYATSNFVSVPLADVVASLLSAAAVVALVRVWRPRRPTPTRGRSQAARPTSRRPDSPSASTHPDARLTRRRREGLRALRDHHRGVRRLPDRRGEEAARQGDDQVPTGRASTSSAPRASR